MSFINNRGGSFTINPSEHNKLMVTKTNDEMNHTVKIKKLKTLLAINDDKFLEIKGQKKFNSFHLIGEDEQYKLIEKKIQKKILNMSMYLIDNYKIDSDISINSHPRKISTKSDINNEIKITNIIKNNIANNFFRSSFLGQQPRQPKLSFKAHNISPNSTSYKDKINEKSRKIKRINHLYDSFGEDESDKDMEQNNYGLNPKSIFIDIYDICLLISVNFCHFYIPYRLSKTKMIIDKDEYFILIMIYFSESIYIIDLIFGFFRCYYNYAFKLINNSYMIIRHYFYTYFFLDLITAIPFYSILNYLNGENENNNIYNENYFIIKILVCLKALKFIKINNPKNNRFVYFCNKKFTKNYYMEKIYQICMLILTIFSVFNLFINFHIYIAKLSYPNWIISSNLQDKSFLDIYISSLYFIMTTLTSVGYGDITCISKEETCFQIILLSVGLVAYSWIISTVGDYVKNKSRATINYNRDMAKLEEIRVQYPNMPFKLYNKIQQHIQRILTQSKKYEYNILINSLPYYLQSSVLFEIHKNEINKFTFFKNCDNSDFILKVLTHFIPIFSKKNIVLVGEGEFYENIFFIKEGRLSLEAIIDLNQIEISIEKYLKYRFEEIEEIEDFSEGENSFEKSKIMDKSFKSIRKKKLKPKKYIEMINKQFENLEDNISEYESKMGEEIGKCDFHLENQDLYKGDIQYIHILDLLKNEYFGEILMFLNIPNPLSLKVQSKRVELYILRKKDAFNIKIDYLNIWKRISRKSIHNIKSLKSLTLDIINRYCEMNGLIVKDNEIINSKTRKAFYLGSNNTTNFNKNQTNFKSMSISKFAPSESKNRENLKINISTKSSKRLNKMKSYIVTGNKRLNISNKEKLEKYKSFDIGSKRKKTISTSIESSSSKNQVRLKIFNNKKISKKNKSFNYQKKSLKQKGKKLPPFSSLTATYLPVISLNKKIRKMSQKTNKFLNLKISNINECNSYLSNSFRNITKESTINFQILSIYNNINKISKGQYIKDIQFQDLIQNIVKFYTNLELEEKKDYIKKYNYFSFSSDKNLCDRISSDFNKLPKINYIEKKPSSFFDKTKNNGDENSKNKHNKYLFLNDFENKLYYYNSKDRNSFLGKEKYLFESFDSKSISSINKLNLIVMNKNQEIKSESQYNDINSSYNEQCKNNKIKYKHDEYLQKLKNEEENNIHEVNLNYVNNFCLIY